MPAYRALCDSGGTPSALFQSKALLSSAPPLASIPEPESSKLCPSPHPSAVSFSSHLHDNRHRPFHKSLPCKTHSPFFFPTSNRKLKIKHNRTHKHQRSYFFFTVTWTRSSFQRCCVTAQFLLLPSHFLPIAGPENPSPKPLLRATRTTPRSQLFHSLRTRIPVLPSAPLLGPSTHSPEEASRFGVTFTQAV